MRTTYRPEPMYRPGDRVEVGHMVDDPDPVPTGTQGTVTSSGVHDFGDGPFEQVAVKWDNGRTLMAVCPPDSLRVVKEEA